MQTGLKTLKQLHYNSILSYMVLLVAGLTCGAPSFLSGERGGKVLLYQAGQFPRGFIGPSHFLWRPLQLEQAAPVGAAQVGAAQVSEALPSRALWLWLHPTAAKEAHLALQTASNTLPSVTVSLMQDEFVQFCLWGPRSLAVLASVLKPADLQEADAQSTNKSAELMQLLGKDRAKDEMSIVAELQWWKKLESLQVETLGRNHANFAQLQELDSSAQVPAGLVLGAVVCDPRLDTPAKREHVAMRPTEAKGISAESVGFEERQACDAVVQENDGGSGDELEMEDVLLHTTLDGDAKGLPAAQQDSPAAQPASPSDVLAACPLSPSPQLAYSPLWDSQLRRQASESKVSDAILNKVRSSGLVRSAELHLGDLACCVPVLLVHQDYQTSTRASHSHCASGWTLICPKRWGMPFFVNLVYRCAHVCGLQELQQAAFESGSLHFPTDYPDAPASQQEWEEEGCALEEAYTRYPPAKRPNYGKLGVQSPFYIRWGGLFKQNDEDSTEGFYVLRSQPALQVLRAAASPSTTSKDAVPEADLKGDIQRGLVALDVTMLRKGCPEPRAMICLPTASDLDRYQSDPRYSGHEEDVKPSGMCVVEKGSVHIGQSKLRKQELKLAKKQWKKDVKKKEKSASPTEGQSTAQPLAETSLQLYETTPSRKVIGYITSGGFSHRLGCGRGVGFCPVPDLLQVVQQSRTHGLAPTVLVRNPSSRQYFVAQVAVH